jgi:peroxiredoxin Q/BCP
MFGREIFGTQRDTFLIDPSGTIVALWRNVSVKGHADEVKVVLLKKQEERSK